MPKPTSRYVKIQGRLLKLTNLSKVLYPETGFTKQDLIHYYRDVAPAVLPHLCNRPFTFRRLPDGVAGMAFYEKQCPHHRPEWVQTGWFGSTQHCLVNDLATLLWVANLAAIELHTTLGTIQNLQRPSFVVFDLDPGEGTDLRQCLEVARLLRALFDHLRLECFVKTSGKKGLHVYVPLNTDATFAQTRPFARNVAEALERRHPDLVTSQILLKSRHGKVYIDWQQNVDFKTTTTVYSLRANNRPTVSTPLSWNEVQLARRKDSHTARLLEFEPEAVLHRLKKSGDLFAPVLSLKQRITMQGIYNPMVKTTAPKGFFPPTRYP